MDQIRIIIADDHLMVREGIKQLIELEGDIKVVGEASDGLECLELMKSLEHDVVLLDINMPNCNGLQVLERLKEESTKTKVLILTIHNEVEYLIKAVEIGVNGYILKDSDSNELRRAIISVYQGETYIQPSLTPILNDRLRIISERNSQYVDILTRRELEVLHLLADGLFNKEIAYKLCISEKTVKNHVSNIFKKIGVSDRTQAAVYAIKHNIVDVF